MSNETVETALAAIRERIDEIEADDRYQAETAIVEVNAPLALIQQDMAGELRGLYRAKHLLDGEAEASGDE